MSRFAALLLTLGVLNGCGVAAARRADQSATVTRAPAEMRSDEGSISVLQAAKPLRTPSPQYPESERASGAEGRVVVHFEVDERGKVSVISAEGPTAFRQKALEAMTTWRFMPAMVDGVPRRSERNARFEFRVGS
jgi:TonB family protein